MRDGRENQKLMARCSGGQGRRKDTDVLLQASGCVKFLRFLLWL